MDPADPKPPRTDLPDLFSDPGSSVPTVQRNAQGQGHTLPSANAGAARAGAEVPPATKRGHSGDVKIISAAAAPAQITMPSGALAQMFRPTPAMTALGGETVEWSPPRLVRVRYPAHEGWHNASATLSSGFVVAMFEPVYAALAHAAAPERQSAVVETSVRFFRAIRGGHVVVDGSTVRAGRTTVTVECIAWDSAGEFCAKGTATLMLVGG